jgi:hypothetical protein
LRRILILFLAFSLLFSYFPLTIARAALPEIELSYDSGDVSYGQSSGGLLGLGVLFTPPSGNYSLTKIKFFEYSARGLPSNDSFFDIEVWDSNRSTLLNLTFKYGDYFNEVVMKWIIVEVPPTPIHGDFWVCIFPNLLFYVGGADRPQASGRSCAVLRSDHSIFMGPFMESDFMIRTIMSPTPLPSDLNSDGIVDIFDAQQLGSAFGADSNDTRWNPRADFNNDGIIDIYDCILLCIDFGKTS